MCSSCALPAAAGRVRSGRAVPFKLPRRGLQMPLPLWPAGPLHSTVTLLQPGAGPRCGRGPQSLRQPQAFPHMLLLNHSPRPELPTVGSRFMEMAPA